MKQSAFLRRCWHRRVLAN